MTKQSHIDVNQTVECPRHALLKSGTACYTTHASHIELKHNLCGLFISVKYVLMSEI